MAVAPPEPPHERPLAEAIAVSTRSVHAKLNKLIVDRLPLALPPRTPDPALYVSGLLHIAPIYITFEALWRNILDAPPATDGRDTSGGCDHYIRLSDANGLESSQEEPGSESSPPSPRMHALLGKLRLPGLMRSDRLRADIKHLTGWPEHIVEEELKKVGQMGRLGDFTRHIKRSVEHRPHVLLAYSYILFMALFAGGRFIRAALESVGNEFWDQVPSPIKPTLQPCRREDLISSKRASGPGEGDHPAEDFNSHASHTMPLRFFHFPTPMDGEDLKREFKQRLAESESLLTTQEKQDILKESVCIFDNMTLLVQQLDMACDDPDRKQGDLNLPAYDISSFFRNPLRARLRDSVAVAKERRVRSSRSSSETSNSSYLKRRRDSRGDSSRDSGHGAVSKGHPAVLNMSDVDLCPASKSMRFQSELPRPTFNQDGPAESTRGFTDSIKLASKKVRGAHVVNWLIVVGFGVVVLGAFLSTRRSG